MTKTTEPCELKKLVIDRSKWGVGGLLRGPNLSSTPVLDPLRGEGRMCCLGHVLIACGNTARSISGCGMPQPMHLAPSWIYDRRGDSHRDPGPTADAYMAAEINDHADPKEKEGKLIALFAKNGCQLSFVGELLPGSNK